MQISLFNDQTKRKSIIHVQPDKCKVSWLNPRRTRPKDHIDRLAERMNRNGFEITRALWAYADNGHYEVFAGGTRLEAAKVAGVDELPVVLHEGYNEDELTRLADEDNENDEYHAPVSVVDVWMDYKRLADAGWTQQRIADAKGVSRQLVQQRLDYTLFAQGVLHEFATKDFLKEGHAREIRNLLQCSKLEPWIDIFSQLAVVRDVLDKHGKSVTAKHFKEAIEAINQVVQLAQGIADTLNKQTLYSEDGIAYDWDAGAEFLSQLHKAKARTPQAVKTAEHKVRKMVSDNLKAHQERLAEKARQAEEEERKAKPIEVRRGQWWRLGNHRLYCGDTSQPEFYNSVSGAVFAFADPPYNAEVDTWDKDFVWNHDWLQDKAKVVAVTPGVASIKDFMQRSTMRYLWSISCWIDNGMTRGAVGFGNWIYIAMHSAEDSLYANAQDVIRVSIDNGEREANNFKGRKPSALLERLVEMYSKQGETIVDPFLGYGTTLYVAERMGRNCIGGEIDEGRCKDIIERYEAFTGIKGELLNG